MPVRIRRFTLPAALRRWPGNALVLALALLGIAAGALLVYRALNRAHPAPTFPAGTWTEWRGSPTHQGYQALAADIAAPAVQWRYRLGGQPSQAAFCDVESDQGPTLFVLTAGKLQAYQPSGALIWSTDYLPQTVLLGCWDVDGDGQPEVITGRDFPSGARLDLFAAQSGAPLWTSPSTLGRLGAVKMIDVDQDGLPELVWAPAAVPDVWAYTFKAGAAAPDVLWHTALADYVSDPYSFSPIAAGDLDGDGALELVIAGARHQKPILVLDAATGRELARRLIDEPSLESGGVGQLLLLQDVDGDALPEIILIGGYSSDAAYMFQGIAIACYAAGALDLRFVSTDPAGAHYVEGSVQDFDGDGAADILASVYVAGRHHLRLYAADLSVQAELNDVYLLGVLAPASGDPPLIVGLSGATSEVPSDTGGTLTLLRYDGGFVPVQTLTGVAPASITRKVYGAALVDNPGQALIASDQRPAGSLALYAYADPDGDGQWNSLVRLDASSGEVTARFAPEAAWLTVLTVEPGAEGDGWLVVGTSRGDLVLLDQDLHTVGQLPVGDYTRNRISALNGHSSEVALIANLDGHAPNEILVVDSENRLVVLHAPDSDAAEADPTARPIWGSSSAQSLLALPASGGTARFVVTSGSASSPALSLIDAHGKTLWEHRFADESGPIYAYSSGDFNADHRADIVLSIGDPALPQKRTYALNGVNGAELWRSETGTYWDASFAVADLNQDGYDDVALNYDQAKGIVLNGKDGSLLYAAAASLNYSEELETLDYNGALSVVDLPPADGIPNGQALLDAEDDVHMLLLGFDPGASRVLWAVPQQKVDDERSSMAAIAPQTAGPAIVGVGSYSGNLYARRLSDGTPLWQVQLAAGQLVTLPSATDGDDSGGSGSPLSSVLALDVDHDGALDFVVGDGAGWLYAITAQSGNLVWSLDLGSPLGDPIAGDIDGDGLSEILVPAADGYLYAIDGG